MVDFEEEVSGEEDLVVDFVEEVFGEDLQALECLEELQVEPHLGGQAQRALRHVHQVDLTDIRIIAPIEDFTAGVTCLGIIDGGILPIGLAGGIDHGITPLCMLAEESYLPLSLD